MELKEFVKQTIIQITDGLREGHLYIVENKFGSGVKDDSYRDVNFDVAITSSENETSDVGGKISVANVFTVGGKNENATRASNESRIQFKILLHVKTGGQLK